jgi:phosphoribosylamine---glycine ligase
MHILLIGSGGREHALAWRLASSPSCNTLYAAPGNPGIGEEALCVDLDVADHDAVVGFCAEKSITLVVVGPEGPLVDGLADSLRKSGIAVFGPNKAAARLEGSKNFTKEICSAAGIPTAAYEYYTNAAEAISGLSDFGLPVVIKADGLAAGKGVVIAETHAEAVAAITDNFSGGEGASVVIEEFMTGEEASFFALTDGITVAAFGSAQDHKRAYDGDTGPNTGGMGAYSPAPVFTPEIEAQVMARIIHPTVEIMAQKGMAYNGVLFAGLMLTQDGPKLIEYNCRFGDPECQVLMTRFNGDLAALMYAVATEKLADARAPSFDACTALTVVMAAKGYPAAPEKGGVISGIDAASANGAKIFHAGTAVMDGALVANGGRVLNVTATGSTVTDAQAAAYASVAAVNFPTGFTRSDIGWREIERESRR